MPFSPSLLLCLSLDSRLGGWQPQRWMVQPGLVVEAGIRVYSTMAEAFYLCKTASSLPSRDSEFWVEYFGDEGEAHEFVIRELLLYSLTLPLIICLPLKEKKNERRQQRKQIQRMK